jgi:CHASE2 domain-containing sensor protein
MSSPVKVVVLELDGDCRIEPVRVKLEFGPAGQRPTLQSRGELPPCPELIAALDRWRYRYRHLGQINRALKPQEILYEGRIRPVSVDECRAAAEDLSTQFQQWLAVDSFRLIDEQLREECHRGDAIQVSIRTQNRVLQRLPWHLWRFIERYPQAEVGLSAPVAELPPQTTKPRRNRNIRILAILGHSDGIDIERDRRLLNHIPGAEVHFLPSPGRENLSQSLWDEPWDILFFAGHSETEDTQGRIYLSNEESLTLDELKNSLRRAIRNGLKLAIFNSCDGLGLAYELEQLNIPQMIVMREPVPDLVAQAFLKGFLQAFSQGASLYEAVREARERLEGLQGQYPCASWLPVIFENPIAPALSWQSLKSIYASRGYSSLLHSKFNQIKGTKISKAALAAIFITLLVVGLRTLGWLQSWELHAYDHMTRMLQNTTDISQRVLAITIDDRDLDYQQKHGIRSEGSISDAALLQLLTKLEPHQPAVIGFDIMHDFPFSSGLEAYFTRNNNFVAICRADIPESDLPGVLPPSNLSEDKLGFINFPLDYDGVLRRQLLGMGSDGFCPSPYSFSFKIAEQYLNQTEKGGFRSARDENFYYLHHATFKELDQKSGGYQLPIGEDGGFQILTDYKNEKIPRIPLREVLSMKEDRFRGQIEDKIMLIGVDTPGKDRHITPLVSDFTRQTPGVIVHARMINTLLNAAYGKVRPITWWPEIVEVLWIGMWALLSAFIAILISSRLIYLEALILIAIQYGICLYGMSVNFWIPFVPVSVVTVAAIVLGKALNHKSTSG